MTNGNYQIFIDVDLQQLKVLRKNSIVTEKIYAISTATAGIGCTQGSLCTPVGKFRIAEKIGDGARVGTIFSARVATGEIWDETDKRAEDLILTRILCLEGMEAHNQNTRSRFIYIHGTNHELLIGKPASHGCIRLKNKDIAELFELIEQGSDVYIESESSQQI